LLQITCPEGAYPISPGTDLIENGMKDALSRGIKQIYLEPGIHILTERLTIQKEITISGAGRGFTFVEGYSFVIEGQGDIFSEFRDNDGKHSLIRKGKNCTLMDFTVQKTKESGLVGSGVHFRTQRGMSFDCRRMNFTQCGGCGVWVKNTNGRLINCVITQCGGGGIHCSSDALIQLEGDQTKVDGNCTDGHSSSYGLKACTTSSTIHLLFPLTKESVSTNNHGGRNYACWGGTIERGTIKTVNSF
jgi:hypothetical protein